jgi:S-methylmethionine-dependent homocysteine/selenocysteine methylase
MIILDHIMSERIRDLTDRLAAGEIVILDGGIGTEIQALGAPMDGAVWSAAANLDHPDIVRRVHEDYIRAGADVILTNTFSSGRTAMDPAGLGDRFAAANRRAVELALEARENAADHPVVVAGAMSPFRTFSMRPVPGHESDRRDVEAPLTGEALVAAYREQALLLADAGVELLVLETITSPIDGGAMIEAARETRLPIWLGLTPQRADDGGLGIWRVRRRPDDTVSSFEELVAELVDASLAAVTVMHCDAEVVEPALDALRGHYAGPLGAYPEEGGFVPPNWQFTELGPDEYLARARSWVEHGAQIVGGCCGVRPAHIRALSSLRPAAA